MADCCVGLMGRMCHQQPHCLSNRRGCRHCHRSHHRCHCTPLSSSYPQCVLIVDLAGHCCRSQWRPQRSTRPTIIACWSCPLHCPHSHCFDIAVTESSLCHCRRSSLFAESSKLSRRDPWFNPLILHLLGKGQRTIAIAATAIGANANTNAGANVCSQVIVFVIVPVIPDPPPIDAIEGIDRIHCAKINPPGPFPWISCWRRCPPSSLPCSNPKNPSQSDPSSVVVMLQSAVGGGVCQPSLLSSLPPQPPPPPPYLKADCCIIVVGASVDAQRSMLGCL